MSTRFSLSSIVATSLAAFTLLAACGDSSGDAGSGGSGGAGSGGAGSTDDGAPSAAGTGGSSSGDAEPPGMEGMTAAHNAARAAVDPPAASPIPPLTWDADVAATAQAYADNCVFEHSGAADLGENLAANAGSVVTPASVVERWVAESDFYDYEGNSCASGEVCGHYTQVVWAESLRLGCGYKQCTINSPFDAFQTWDNWVCNYAPPGNFIGEKPY